MVRPPAETADSSAISSDTSREVVSRDVPFGRIGIGYVVSNAPSRETKRGRDESGAEVITRCHEVVSTATG